MMRHNWFGRLIGGLLLIGIGALFLLNQMGITDVSIGYLFSTFWPVFLIFAGLTSLASGNRHGGGLAGSLILLLIGGYFLGSNLGYISLDPGDFFKYFFPLALIIGGICLIFRPRHSHRRHREGFPPHPHRRRHEEFPPPPPSPLDSIFGSLEKEEAKKEATQEKERPKQERPKYEHYYGMDRDKGEVVNKSGFIGDVHLGQDYFQLRPTNISHFIGDTVIDLTKAQIPYGETKINVSSFIGDVKIFIPEDMDIGIMATSSAFIGDLKVLKQKQGGFMSSVSAESPYYREASKKIKLVVSVFIGDVKVNMVG
ncbi:cell wall-active antibiotics response protein LiaF [Paenibacillus macerans]|uniref:cell wall-active antibiotics response protein LiaF n=2 Tax=Paenibacillus macerans TaxID=44252 RepID=UPI002E1F8298